MTTKSSDVAPNGTTTYDLLAYERGNDDNEVTRRGIPAFRLNRAVAWALREGRDTLLVEANGSRACCDTLITHHVCRDPDCPGGC